MTSCMDAEQPLLPAKNAHVQNAKYSAPKGKRFYGPLARSVKGLARCFSKRYTCVFDIPQEPCVYVCRHLNMHGPFVTLKWLPEDVHPFVLNVFMNEKTAVKQFTEYTFSKRYGKKPRRFCLCGTVVGHCAAKIVRSLQAVPVFRDTSAIQTMRCALKYLKKGESLVVWPDVHYTDSYDKPCEIYRGFLYLGELYERSMGVRLKFIPLYIDDEHRTISAAAPVTVSCYRENGEHAARCLESVLNGKKMRSEYHVFAK